MSKNTTCFNCRNKIIGKMFKVQVEMTLPNGAVTIEGKDKPAVLQKAANFCSNCVQNHMTDTGRK